MAQQISPLWLLTGLSLLAGCRTPPPPNYPSIQINRVISGQTVEWIDRSQPTPVIQTGRLAGITAPDLGQEPWGRLAKQRLEASIGMPSRNSISVEFDGPEADSFGRKFIYLWQDGRLLNEQLLREGYVFASIGRQSVISEGATGAKYYERLQRAGDYGRLMGVGIWNLDLPLRVDPHDFRKNRE